MGVDLPSAGMQFTAFSSDLVSYHPSNPFLFQTVEISHLLLFYYHFIRIWKQEEINTCGQSAILNQNSSFLGTRITSADLGELQSIVALTERQSWVSEPLAG